MNSFKFKKVNNKFKWESDFMVLEFSNPSIQGFSNFINLTSEEEIMYYYYTVKIFKKVIEWDDNDNEVTKQKLISERNTHDFPTLLQLKWMLDYQLKDNPIINGQKIEYSNGSVRYSKVMSTEGFACDDFYEITKSVDSEGNDDRFVVYCGATFDSQGDLNSAGIRTPYVSKEDMEELFTCVSDFIQYSLDEHNKWNNILANSYEVKNGKIYEYNSENETINKDRIESIYAVGDILDIKTVIDNQENDYDKVVITKIEGEDIILNNGVTIKCDSIRYISNEPTDEMLKYKENEIAKEFSDILTSEEKEEFKNCNAEFLLNKYKMAIIDRTWMCREEHGFNINDKTGDRVSEITPVVRNIIKLIKKGEN